MTEIIEQSIINLQGEINISNASISIGTLIALYVDKTQILQLFQDLIEHAIKYSQKGCGTWFG